MLRAGLRALLNAEPGLEVVGEAADGDEALRLTRTLQPDIVLMDISMPGCSGIEATPQLKELCPEAKVLILDAAEPPVSDAKMPAVPKDLPAYLRSLYATPLLTTAQEQDIGHDPFGEFMQNHAQRGESARHGADGERHRIDDTVDEGMKSDSQQRHETDRDQELVFE